MSKHYKNLFIIFALVLLTYIPILFNHFIGDDHVIIERNTFYSSWKNIPRLVEAGYSANLQAIKYNSDPYADYGSGSVSYRPVSNFFYFLDYSLFQAKPYGSHLINIVIHCFNAFFVYWIIDHIFLSSALALFTALLFSLHPIQSEAVAVMSYRADILAAFFVLSAFYCWVNFQKGGFSDKKYYAAALLMFFLAVFSKESAVMLPLVILLFDQLLAVPRLSLKRRLKYYSGFILILIFYLYLYIIVFPNSSLSFHWLGGSFVTHGLTMGLIWYIYLINFLFPWTVKLIPGLYCPPAPALLSFISAKILFGSIVFISAALLMWRQQRPVFFFLLWFAVFYIPVSNVIPIANPIASRFMYLPSVGLFVGWSWILYQVIHSQYLKQYSQYFPKMFQAAIILICLTCTLFINAQWKSDFDVGYAWLKDYPTVYRGYALLGQSYFFAGHFKEAKRYLEKSIQLGDAVPGDVLMLGQCYRGLGELHKAEALLKLIILHNPNYADPYFELAAIYNIGHNDILEREMLEKGLAINPNKSNLYSGRIHQLQR